jgi:hypothetical protein
VRYECKTYWSTNFCFKCYRHIKEIHYKPHKFDNMNARKLELENLLYGRCLKSTALRASGTSNMGAAVGQLR